MVQTTPAQLATDQKRLYSRQIGFEAAYMGWRDHECGTRSPEFAQQRLRVEQIRQVKSVTEPAVNRHEKLAGFRPASLIAPKAREAGAGAQLKQPGAL